MIRLEQPGLVVFDMDSTLITIECIDEIAALANRKAEVSAITEAAMRGELDFAESLQQRVASLTGIAESQFEQLFNPIPFTAGAQELCQWFAEKGWKVVIASGGFTWFANRLAAQLPIDKVVANELEWDQQQYLTGRLSSSIVDAQVKADTLQNCAQHWGISLDNTIAVGDGANDIPMLQQAALSVAFCGKPKVREVADWCIDSPNLFELATRLEQVN